MGQKLKKEVTGLNNVQMSKKKEKEKRSVGQNKWQEETQLSLRIKSQVSQGWMKWNKGQMNKGGGASGE